MNPGVIQVRRDICQDCAQACDVRDTINHADPCAACPLGIWHAVGNCEGDSSEPMRGLGDAVALIANPIARAIDAATGNRMGLSKCGGCKARQAALNKSFPFRDAT